MKIRGNDDLRLLTPNERSRSNTFLNVSSRDLDVRHVARLARIALREEEVSTFQGQLDRVLEHIEHLKKLDVSAVEPTAHTYPIFNVTRHDLPQTSLARESVLSLAPRAGNNLVIVPKVVE